MSIKALFYITGDTQQSGFRCIGGSETFPADSLPLLNNGETIQERARVESGSSRQGSGGVQQLSHVWEYQTGRYGLPVVINTMGAIATGRAHAFSEYVAGETENIAETADPGAMIRGAESFDLLDVEKFMQIPGRETVDCPEQEWIPRTSDMPVTFDQGMDENWKMTVLSNYWKQASIRAFSEDSPSTVRINLGEFSENIQEDIEETIRQAKKFFVGVIVPGLPKQVQNIASMAAGVNCADRSTLYTALEFDIFQNMYEEETLHLKRPRELRGYRLNDAEMEFITEVSKGNVPAVVTEFFEKYKELTEDPELTETRAPFMADYRVWYSLYCIDRIAKEKHAFIEKAGLMNEHGNPRKVRDARACFILLQQFRKLLENDHRLNTTRRTLVTELTDDLEVSLLKVMAEDMETETAESFLIRRNDMVDFHRRTLYTAPDDQLELLIRLAVLDASVSKGPQFVRCYPATPIRNEAADERNGKLLAALLPAVMRKRIDEEKKKETVEDKYLEQLRSEEFADNWACLNHCVQTKQAVADFLREEIQDPKKHFLLYKISLKYIPENELLKMTLRHFTENNTAQNARPEERQLRIAVHGAKEYISNPSGIDPECVAEMNRYYQACFREYRVNITNISEDIIQRLEGDTTGAMILIFEEYAEGKALTAEEAKAVFDTFGGKNGVYTRDESVAEAYTKMLSAQRDKELQDPTGGRSKLVQWLGAMIRTAPFEIDTTQDMVALFNNAAEGERLSADEAANIFAMLDPEGRYSTSETVSDAYAAMMTVQRDKVLQETSGDRSRLINWMGGLVKTAPFEMDTADHMVALFRNAEKGERLTSEEAENIFTLLDPNKRYASSEAVASAYADMISVQQGRMFEDSTQDREATRENLVRWVANMVEKAPFPVDTSDTIKAVFESARTGERMSRASAQDIFSRLMPYARSGEEKVKPAFQNMIREQLDSALKKQDDDVLEWIGGMISASDGVIDYDTTETLKKIFESAKEGNRMRPADAGTAFSTMAGKADGLNTTVQRTYTEMLNVRRKEAVDAKDPDGFTWLCDMADRSPWKNDRDWLSEQHTENVIALNEISQATGNPIESSELSTAQSWLEQGTLTPRGVAQLQRYCNTQLENGNTAPAEMLTRRFSRIDESCEALRNMVFASAVAQLKDGLSKGGASFGTLISSCVATVERAGKRLDDLYKETKEEADRYISGHFEDTADLDSLGRELEQIPEDSAFNREWQRQLGDKVYGQQVAMFNAQPNLEKLIALKESIKKRNNKLQPALESAYRMLESYEGRLQQLNEKDEYGVVTSLGTELSEVRTLLSQSAEVRKTLCSSLRNEKYPVADELRDKSFRHALCGAVMQAMLTDTEREAAGGGKTVKGCPDWNRVLNGLFPKAELDKACRKPYESHNLPVLQRLLATVENARLMAAYGMEEAYVSDLVRTIHSHSDLHRYQSALARNKKMSEQYQLKFDVDGLVFSQPES